MGLLEDIKKRIERQGKGKEGFFFVKDGEKKRIRFLTDLEEGLKVVMHDRFGEVNAMCQKHAGKDCPFCDDESVRTRDNFVWPVYNYDTKAIELFMFKANDKSPIAPIAAMYEEFGSISDRDLVVSRKGTQFATAYTVVPMDRKAFPIEKLGDKVPSRKKMLAKVNMAYPPTVTSKDGVEDEDEIDADDLPF